MVIPICSDELVVDAMAMRLSTLRIVIEPGRQSHSADNGLTHRPAAR